MHISTLLVFAESMCDMPPGVFLKMRGAARSLA